MKRATSVNIRMTDELRGELQRLAEANKRTLSDYIRIVLEEHAEGQRRARAVDAAGFMKPAGRERVPLLYCSRTGQPAGARRAAASPR
jgi:predicted transcriptional regulator